jgi:hypothetical protein
MAKPSPSRPAVAATCSCAGQLGRLSARASGMRGEVGIEMNARLGEIIAKKRNNSSTSRKIIYK